MVKTNINVTINETISYNIKNIKLNNDVFLVDNGQEYDMAVFVEDLKLQDFGLFRDTADRAYIRLELTADLYNSVRNASTNKSKSLSSAQINIELFSEAMEFHNINGSFAIGLGESTTITVVNGKLVDNNHEDITKEIIKRLNTFAVEFDIITEAKITEFNYD